MITSSFNTFKYTKFCIITHQLTLAKDSQYIHLKPSIKVKQTEIEKFIQLMKIISDYVNDDNISDIITAYALSYCSLCLRICDNSSNICNKCIKSQRIQSKDIFMNSSVNTLLLPELLGKFYDYSSTNVYFRNQPIAIILYLEVIHIAIHCDKCDFNDNIFIRKHKSSDLDCPGCQSNSLLSK